MSFLDQQKFHQFFWTAWEYGSGSYSRALGKDNARSIEDLKSCLGTVVGKEIYQLTNWRRLILITYIGIREGYVIIDI